MTNQNSISFDDLTSEMAKLKDFCGLVTEFKVDPRFKVEWNQAVDLVEAGKESEAVKIGRKPVEAIRAILSAYIRNAVFAKSVPEGQTQVPSFFTRRISDRMKEGYDEDIITFLQKKQDELAQAVQTETNGTFNQRVSAYVAMNDALYEAATKQTALDNKILRGGWNVVKPKAPKAKEGQTPEQTEHQAAIARRREMLVARAERIAAARKIF